MQSCKNSSLQKRASIAMPWQQLSRVLLQVVEQTYLGVKALRALRELAVAKPAMGNRATATANGARAEADALRSPGKPVELPWQRTKKTTNKQHMAFWASWSFWSSSLIVLQGLDEARRMGKEEISAEHLKRSANPSVL